MKFDQGRHQPGYNWHSLGIVPWAGQALFVAAMLGLIAFAAGCAGFVAGQTSQTTPPPPSTMHSISGTISPAPGGSGATVTLSGAATTTTTANSSGNYTFTGLANGTYAVTPSHTGYTFNPTSQTATVSGANVTGINFTATVQQTHSVALSWNASTSAVIGYNVYRSTLSGTGYTRMNSAFLAVLAYTDTTVQSGTTYYYVTTAVDSSGTESAYSNEAKAIIP
jgi:SdrD B-like domain